jgi:hypothetical protein
MEKNELELVTSTRTMSCNVVLHDCTRHTRTLPLLTNLEDNREAGLRGLSSFLLGLGNARWLAVHEVNVRVGLGKLVPLGRLQEIL